MSWFNCNNKFSSFCRCLFFFILWTANNSRGFRSIDMIAFKIVHFERCDKWKIPLTLFYLSTLIHIHHDLALNFFFYLEINIISWRAESREHRSKIAIIIGKNAMLRFVEYLSIQMKYNNNNNNNKSDTRTHMQKQCLETFFWSMITERNRQQRISFCTFVLFCFFMYFFIICGWLLRLKI